MAPDTLNHTAALLYACLFETMAYGVAAVLFLESLQTLVQNRKNRKKVNLPLVLAASVLFLFITIHLIGVWWRTTRAFVTYPEGPAAYFALITSPEKTVAQVGQIGSVVVADAMMVYRTYMVWEGNVWAIVLPLFTFVGTLVCSVGFVYVQHQVSVQTSIFTQIVTRWTEGWLSTSLTTTGLCTCLIAFRLLAAQRKLRVAGMYASNSPLMQYVVRVIVESAFVYFLVNLLYVVLYAGQYIAEAWFSGLEAPVASISFSLIITRIHSAAYQPTSTAGEASSGQTISFSRMPNRSRNTPLSVEITASQMHSDSTTFHGSANKSGGFSAIELASRDEMKEIHFSPSKESV